MKISIPCGTCTQCQRKIREGEEARVTLRAGSAWKDGFAEFVDGAELYTATVLCSDCQNAEATVV